MSDFTVFESLKIEGWRQFKNVHINFHKNLTVITGANGAGKTTLLNILSTNFGSRDNFLATPMKTKGGGFRYFYSVVENYKLFFNKEQVDTKSNSTIGTITYTNHTEAAQITIPQGNDEPQYNLKISGKQPLYGLRIRSHRPENFFKTVSTIPISSITPKKAYENYLAELTKKRKGNYSDSSPNLSLKEALISMAIFGEGNSKISPNIEAQSGFNGFIKVLKKLLPPTLGFQTLDVRSPDLVLVTESGEFLIDAASGGISSLIDLAFRIHLFSLFNKKFVVTIDEPENHLHPSLQRNLLSRLINAFPDAQFIVASHSPFMVTSVRDSNVYVLRYENQTIDQSNKLGLSKIKTRVVSELLDVKNKAGSADEILRDVLGVPSTMPEWVGDEIETIVTKFKNKKMTPDLLKELRTTMSEIGFSEYYLEALSKVTYND